MEKRPATKINALLLERGRLTDKVLAVAGGASLVRGLTISQNFKSARKLALNSTEFP